MGGWDRPPRDTAQKRDRHIDITVLGKEEAGMVLPPTTSFEVHCIFFVMVVSPGAKSVGETENCLCLTPYEPHRCSRRLAAWILQTENSYIASLGLIKCVSNHIVGPLCTEATLCGGGWGKWVGGHR